MSSSSDTVIHIEPNRVQKEYLKDLFRFRELFYFLAWRDILVRYKQAFFGVSWAIIRPILNMILFSFLFGRIANLPSDNVNYSLFVLAGMMPWQLFANTLVETSTCLLNHPQLLSKVYFPRIIIPSSQILVQLVDFGINGVLLALLLLITGEYNVGTLIFLPLFAMIALILCIGVSYWISAVTVRFRDVRFIVPFVVQFGMFVSPVGYGSFIIPDRWKWLYFLNPMAGIIDGFRWSIFGITHPFFTYSCVCSVCVSLLLFFTGFLYFRKMERTFADII